MNALATLPCTLLFLSAPAFCADFSKQVIKTPFDGPVEILAADVDGDGDEDAIATSDEGSPKTVWIENTNGLGTFGTERAVTPELFPGSAKPAYFIAAADVDGDGDVDLLASVGASGGAELAWYENSDGLGTFVEHLIDVPGCLGELVAADLDGDSDPDALVALPCDDTIV